MRRNELDFILTNMLESQQEVSDLNFTVDKPLQVVRREVEPSSRKRRRMRASGWPARLATAMWCC